MSSLYKRRDSRYFWYTAVIKGRRLRRSTGLSQRHLAKKVQMDWDLKIAMGDKSFLNPASGSSDRINQFYRDYIGFLEKRKSRKTVTTARGILLRFCARHTQKKIEIMADITVKSINGYLDELALSPKTIKNHLGEVSRMLDQAVREDVLTDNPARLATVPRMIKTDRHRRLDKIDLTVIFENAGKWDLYFRFLYHTGLRAGDVAMLTHGNIDRKRNVIIHYIRKSRRIHEFPLAEILVSKAAYNPDPEAPVFPELYSDSDQRLNDNLFKPRKYMQEILKVYERPKATLHSFRRTFNNALRDLGLQIQDRQALLAHASAETTKVYTNPNLELARRYVNQIPKMQNVTKT